MCTESYIKTQVYIIEQENLDGLFEYIYLSDHEILKSTLYSVHTNNQLYSKQIMCTVHFTHDEWKKTGMRRNSKKILISFSSFNFRLLYLQSPYIYVSDHPTANM